jgi:hypothetical protein
MSKIKRRVVPSANLSKGGSVGTALGTVIEIGASLSGHSLPPGTGALLGGSLATVAAYFLQGGRTGESD